MSGLIMSTYKTWSVGTSSIQKKHYLNCELCSEYHSFRIRGALSNFYFFIKL